MILWLLKLFESEMVAGLPALVIAGLPVADDFKR